jgi:cytochrome c553
METRLWQAEPRPGESCQRRKATTIGLGLVFPAAAMALVLAAAVHAEDAGNTAVPKREAQAKLAYCEECHGVSAQGFHGYYPIPRLAGQQIEYLENQLQAFVERRRTSNIMFNVGHILSPAMISALAANFHDLDPKPLGGGPKELAATGKKIFEEGIPTADIPACASCHGPEAKGEGEFPRLAGQLYGYVTNKLTNWSKERGQNPANPDTSAIMAPIAHSLTKPQIEAVAAYVSNLE